MVAIRFKPKNYRDRPEKVYGKPLNLPHTLWTYIKKTPLIKFLPNTKEIKCRSDGRKLRLWGGTGRTCDANVGREIWAVTQAAGSPPAGTGQVQVSAATQVGGFAE
jgi:hypothetical protein